MAKVSQGQQQQAADNNAAKQQANIAGKLKTTATTVTTLSGTVATLQANAITRQPGIGNIGATGGPYSTNAVANLNDLAGDVSNIAARLNQIYATLSNSGVTT